MQHRINDILCCVGLRSDSNAVLEEAMSLAMATGAKVHVMHAVKSLSDDVMNTLKVNIRDRQTLETLMRQRLDQAKQQLDDKLDEFWKRHPQEQQALAAQVAAVEIAEGYPAAVITRVAKERGCDLIVMANNKRGFTASYAGRVTKGVLKRSPVPVVVVPPTD